MIEKYGVKPASIPDWLALVGNDVEFIPREPWARHHGQWLGETKKAWEELAGHPWRNPIASRIYKNYNKHLDIWSYDHRGSLNAVYAFLRELGVRWYMPGEIGEVALRGGVINRVQKRAVVGEALLVDTTDSLVYADGRPVAVFGQTGVAVVAGRVDMRTYRWEPPLDELLWKPGSAWDEH